MSAEMDWNELEEFEPLLADLYKWAHERAGGNPRLLGDLICVVGAVARLVETCGLGFADEEPGEILRWLAKVVASQRPRKRRGPKRSSVYDELERKCRDAPPGNKAALMREFAETHGIDFEHVKRQLNRRRKKKYL